MTANNLLGRTQRWLARHTLKRPLQLQPQCGVVSFSFDDAPQSACHHGARVLERHGCRGTWYIAGGLTDRPEQGSLCHSAQDVIALAQRGHHIGCHTFSHRPCTGLSKAQIQSEFAQNAAFFASLGLPATGLHFSFPLGAFDLQSKALAASTFQSARITGGGAHFGVADLNALKSERLYDAVMTPDRIQALVRQVAQYKGWLILYTHDVETTPSAWGCTPQLLDTAVLAAIDAGCQVLPVDQAIRRFQQNPAPSAVAEKAQP